MNRRTIAWAVTPWLAMTIPYGAAYGGSDEVTTLLRLMPADFPVAAVVVDFEKLDKSIAAAAKALDEGTGEPWILADIKGKLGIGEWIDFSKPFGVAMPSVGGEEGTFWAKVPDFAAKVKALEGATEEEGVWRLSFEKVETLFCALKGDYLVAAGSKEALTQATKDGKSLADEMKSRMDLLRGRDALIHVNIDPLRPTALGGLAQGAQMAPMLAMLVGAQGGADPAVMTGMFTSLLDAAKAFVEQVAYIDITIGVSEDAGRATIATGYKDGPIKTYLAKQKPASAGLLTQIQEQPYFVALGYHFPGETSPFFDYMLDKITSAMKSTPAAPGSAPGTEDAAPGGQTDALKKAMGVARELYRKTEGQNMAMAVSPGGMRMSGDYISRDPRSLLELLKQSLISANPLMQQFGAGATYEALGSKKIGQVTVEEFTVKLDPTNPNAAMLTSMYGENSRLAMGIAGGRVRFCMGSDEQMQQVFSGKVDKPFTSSRYVSEAIATLPAKRNAVILIDPVGVLPIVGPMMGMPKTDTVSPGPPVAISASFAGEPARVDIHIPLQAIERLMKAMSPEKPE